MRKKRIVRGMILAAGFGTRLAPITDFLPKPLIPLPNVTLIETILQRLADAGITRYAINTHYLADILTDSLANSTFDDKVEIYFEPEILGTGGPIVNAKSFLKHADAFILHNGDILCDANFEEMLDFHFEKNASVTMMMIDGPENKVALNDEKVIDILGLLKRTTPSQRLMTYAGIAVFSKDIFKYLPKEPINSSIITAIIDMMRSGKSSVAAYCPKERNPERQLNWSDLGTPEKYLQSLNKIKEKRIVLPDKTPTIKSPLTQLPHKGASERIFFRTAKKNGDNSSVVISCSPPGVKENEYFVNYANYFSKLGIGTPEIYSSSADCSVVAMEDLGDETILSVLHSKKTDKLWIEKTYMKIIDFLIDFQYKTYFIVERANKKDAFSSTEVSPEFREFSKEYYEWETQYFAENFLFSNLGIEKRKIETVRAFFQKLAKNAFSHPRTLIHRDFQSQNILIKSGKVRIVDFQGARIGHFAYDLASLLYDPYANLKSTQIENLSKYYYDKLKKTKLLRININNEEFKEYFQTAALQRIMQALGAYSFLGLKKGKKHYLKHMPAGLNKLESIIQEIISSKKSESRFDGISQLAHLLKFN